MATQVVDAIRELDLPLAKFLKKQTGQKPDRKGRRVTSSNLIPKPSEIIVALDGSGNFRSVQEAIMSVPAATAQNPVIIRIKPGTYKELIYIQREKRGMPGRVLDPEGVCKFQPGQRPGNGNRDVKGEL
jgi:Pectinesterase